MANEKRLIDADALMDAFRVVLAERHDRERCVSEENCKVCDRECLWRRVVKKAPTVDAVEVVRCKDCKHFGGHGTCFCHAADENGTPIFVREDDFCSHGERKEDA